MGPQSLLGRSAGNTHGPGMPFITALSRAYHEFPHTYIVGLLSLMLSIQLLGLGILALQSKRYYEEMFHLSSAILRQGRSDKM